MPTPAGTSRALRRTSEGLTACDTTRPLTRVTPSDGVSSMARQRSRVVFPDPLGPMSDTTSFCANARLIPRKTSVAPNRFFNPWASIKIFKARLRETARRQYYLLWIRLRGTILSELSPTRATYQPQNDNNQNLCKWILN